MTARAALPQLPPGVRQRRWCVHGREATSRHARAARPPPHARANAHPPNTWLCTLGLQQAVRPGHLGPLRSRADLAPPARHGPRMRCRPLAGAHMHTHMHGHASSSQQAPSKPARARLPPPTQRQLHRARMGATKLRSEPGSTAASSKNEVRTARARRKQVDVVSSDVLILG